MDAITAVFDTAELLEAILLMLRGDEKDIDDRRNGMRSLLRCLRVSKTFQATINNSPQLQKHLFLRPQCRTNREHTTSTSPKQLSFNDILKTFNPLLFDRQIVLVTGVSSIYIKLGVRSVPIIDVGHKRTAPTTSTSIPVKAGSWRNMLLCDPTLSKKLVWY